MSLSFTFQKLGISLFCFKRHFSLILQFTATICGTDIYFVDYIPEQRAHRLGANNRKSWSYKRRYHATSKITALLHEHVQFPIFF